MGMNLKDSVDMVSPKYCEIVARTHTTGPYSCSRLMVVYFEEVGLSMNLENIVEFGRPICFKTVAQPPYGFYTLL